jgi:hypothetical protein
MRRTELVKLAPGDIVYDKQHGLPFEFVSISPIWNGFLTTKELNERKPDSYELVLKPIDGQDYYGLYKFGNHYTFGRGISIDSKKMKLGE